MPRPSAGWLPSGLAVLAVVDGETKEDAYDQVDAAGDHHAHRAYLGTRLGGGKGCYGAGLHGGLHRLSDLQRVNPRH